MNGSQTADLEEIAPDRFLVRNQEARRFLKGEGDFQGVMFVLTSWRRDGLLARLRQNGLVAYTLEDQVRNLPRLPPAVPIGEARHHPLRQKEQLSHFDPASRTWSPVEATAHLSGQAQSLAYLRVGWVVRQRRGRGIPRFARVADRHQGSGLMPLSETAALLSGYAQAANSPHPPLPVPTEGATCYFPALELPAPHRETLRHLGTWTPQGWKMERRSVPLACEIYHLLGVHLDFVPPEPEPTETAPP
ncbi:MAG: hypothetical protein HC884_06195 [Chloroflexaceae bacterium]|nr:hypothetical protein [Chloroflexaceae bacterium]